MTKTSSLDSCDGCRFARELEEKGPLLSAPGTPPPIGIVGEETPRVCKRFPPTAVMVQTPGGLSVVGVYPPTGSGCAMHERENSIGHDDSAILD